MEREYRILEKMSDGIENDVWKILNTNNEKIYILKRRCKQRIDLDPDGPKKQYDILSGMCEKGIPVVPPCKENIFFSGQKDILYPFVEGESKLPNTAKMISQLVNIIHMYTSYHIKNNNTLSKFDKTFLQLQIDDMSKSIKNKKHDLIIEKKLDYLAYSFPEKLELCEEFVHGDLHPGNILWKGEDIVALVDWDNCMIGPKELDVAHMYVDLLLLAGEKTAGVFLNECRRKLNLSNNRIQYFKNYELLYALLNHHKWTQGFFGKNSYVKLEELDDFLISMIKYNF